MLEFVEPTPAFPAVSLIPVMFTEITFSADSRLSVGVKVAFQIVPAPESLTAVKVPLAIVRSSLAKPDTDSEKVKVTTDVSPTLSAASVKTAEVRVSPVVSIA